MMHEIIQLFDSPGESGALGLNSGSPLAQSIPINSQSQSIGSMAQNSSLHCPLPSLQVIKLSAIPIKVSFNRYLF